MSQTDTAPQILRNSKTIVIKIGSVLVTDQERDMVRQPWLDSLAEDVDHLIRSGKRVVIVTSGGIALGRREMGISQKTAPGEIRLEHKQAASSIGQFHLFHGYHKAFERLDLSVGQILLTMDHTENRRMHLNARATITALLERGIVPIINENDTISTGEIRFGDNDRLAARVAQMIDADAILLLSTIDGLYTANPEEDKTAAFIDSVDTITDKVMAMGGEPKPGLSTGGMKSKLEAAQLSTRAGIPLIIADGQRNYAVSDILNETKRTTVFIAQETGANARQRWIASHLAPRGAYILDKGAAQALLAGKSLLPIGVTGIEGTFERGDAVEIKGPDGLKLGIGLSAYSSDDAKRIIGERSEDIPDILGYLGRDELVHRNDMVMG